MANLPAEISHLLEEIEAKDKEVQEHRNAILSRDSSIQRHLKQNGCGVAYPKEEGYCKNVSTTYDKAQAVQDEKLALSEKAASLLDRQLKRLDTQIKALETAGVLTIDTSLPSLLNSGSGRLSAISTGVSSPLNPINGNATSLSASAVTNAAVARLIGTSSATPNRRDSTNSAVSTPTVNSPTSALARSAREGSIETKKRRLANEPKQSSGLRQSSLGPMSTPKSTTPSGQGRAGSAGPRSGGVTKGNKIVSGPKRVGSSLNPASAAKKAGGRRKGGRKGTHGLKPSPSDGDDSALSEVGDSENERGSQLRNSIGNDGAGDTEMGVMEEEDEEEADGDNRKYCTCRSVSYGNMIACDNDDCEYEWFHWGCVGMTKEPAGKWYCEACKIKLGIK